MKELDKLRSEGYRVKIWHTRNLNPDGSISPRGGSTDLKVISPEGVEYSGWSECSLEDNFNKRFGVRIALGRALAKKDTTGSCGFLGWEFVPKEKVDNAKNVYKLTDDYGKVYLVLDGYGKAGGIQGEFYYSNGDYANEGLWYRGDIVSLKVLKGSFPRLEDEE